MSTDWFPRRREDQLAMAKRWLDLIAVHKTEWKIPDEALLQLGTDYAVARAAYQKVQSAERTPAVTAECNTAFRALEATMRDIKRRYIYVPPFTEAQIIEMGLHLTDTTKTSVPPPEGFPKVDVGYPGVGVLELYLSAVAGQTLPDPRGEYGYRYYWGILPPGGASVEDATGARRLLMKVPVTGDELPHSKWTRRKKESLDLHEYSGSRVFLCVRYENSKGENGPWGPLVSAIIP